MRSVAVTPKFEEELSGEEDEFSATESDEEASARCRRRLWFACCAGSLSCLVVTVLFSVILAPFIGKAVAERVIEGLDITFSSIDIGAINGTSTLFPHVIGRVNQQSPFPAKLFPARGALKAAVEPLHSGDSDMVFVGSVSLPEISIDASQDISLDITLEFEVRDPAAFGRAGRHFIVAQRASWLIEAAVDVQCWVFGFVPLVIRGIALRKAIELQGLGGFSQDVNPVLMQKVSDAYGQPGALAITVSVALQNPSYISAHIARSMQFQVVQRGQMFGTALIEDLHLRPGQNVIDLQFLLTDTETNQAAIRKFIVGYIKAKLQPVTVLGSDSSTPDPFLSAILRGLNATFNFQPPPTQFIRKVEAHIGMGVTALATIYNPLPRAITMGDLDLNIQEQNEYRHQIFRLKTQGSITNVPGAVLQPQQTSVLNIKLNPFDAKLADSALVGRLIEAAKEGRLAVAVSGPVTITIQPSFTVTVDYVSDNITAVLKCPFFCR